MNNKMTYFKMNNGYEIPQLGLGVFLIRDHEMCKKAVLTAIKNGYRHIDTAQLYKNEKAVGEAIRESDVPREEIFVTTKIWTTNFGYEKTKKAIRKSLEDLQLEYIDLMLLHQQFEDYIGSWKALEEAVDEGLIQSIGISNFNMKRSKEILNIARIKPVVNQVECHPYNQQNEMREFLKEKDILLEAWAPLGQGDKKLWNEPLFSELGKKYGRNPIQIILRWHIQKGHIIFPKSTSEAHLKDNMSVFEFSLSDEDMKRINEMDKKKPYLNLPEWVQRIFYKIADKF